MFEANATAVIVFDRASSRVFDQDGHLHVRRTPISKACVNDYLGREIPGWEDLGLDADRRYSLLRDPAELAKGAETFAGKPLLFDHNPVSADEHDHVRTVGAIANPLFEHPYLFADLSCWSGPAIRTIQDGSQKELSSAYRYTPDMTPGVYEGVRYDGVMRDIIANHVALVRKGRAGPDVVVGDSWKGLIMAKRALSPAAAQLQGALSVYVRGKMAQDATIDLGPIVDGVTKANFAARKPVVVLGVKGLLHGKLAKDADLDDVEAMIDRVEEAVEDLQDTVEEVPTGGGEEEPPARDASTDEVVSFLQGKLSDEDLATVRRMLGGETAPPPAADKTPPAQDTKTFVTRQAMDAAIRAEAARAAREATETANRTQREIRDAERDVRPDVGDLAIAQDSAASVYRTALTLKGVEATGVPDEGLKALYHAARKAGFGEAPRAPSRSVAQDTAAIAAMEAEFPHLRRLNA